MPTYALPPNSSFWNNVAPIAYGLKGQLTTSKFEKALSLDLVHRRIESNYTFPSKLTKLDVRNTFQAQSGFGIEFIDAPIYPIW